MQAKKPTKSIGNTEPLPDIFSNKTKPGAPNFKTNDDVIEDGISSFLLLEYAKRNGMTHNSSNIEILKSLRTDLHQQLKNSLLIETTETAESLIDYIFPILLDIAQKSETFGHNRKIANAIIEFSGANDKTFELLDSELSDFYERSRRAIAHTLDQIPSLVGFHASEYFQKIDLSQCLTKYLQMTDPYFREELEFKGKFNTTSSRQISTHGVDNQTLKINHAKWDFPFPNKRHQMYVKFSWTLEHLTFTVPIEKIHTNRDQIISSITRTLEIHDQSSRIINNIPKPENFYADSHAKSFLLENPDKYTGKYHFRLDTRMIASRIIGLMAWDYKNNTNTEEPMSGSMAINRTSRHLRELGFKRYAHTIIDKALQTATKEVKTYTNAHVPWLSENERLSTHANRAISTISPS